MMAQRLFLLSAGLYFIASSVFAQDFSPTSLSQDVKVPTESISDVKASWTNSKGVKINPGFVVKGGWSMRAHMPSMPSLAPMYLLQIEIPKNYIVDEFTSVDAENFTYRHTKKDGTHVLELAIRKESAKLDIKLSTVHRTTPAKITLDVSLSPVRTALLRNPECIQLGFAVGKRVSQQKPMLYLGLSCEQNESDYIITFMYPPNISFDKNYFGSYHNIGDGWVQYKIPRPRDVVVTNTSMGRTWWMPDGEYILNYTPPGPYKRLYASFGLAHTYMVYKEEIDSIRLSQQALTGKVNTNYELVPGVFDIGANIFATLVPFAQSPSNYTSIRFYGLNARLGYRLPVDLGATTVHFLTGWYFWGMSVPNNTFGIKSLSGPQAYMMLRRSAKGRRTYFFYGKYAPILGDGFTFSNRELAMGAGYQLTSPHAKYLISATFDLAHTQYHSNTQFNGLKLLSFSSGVQIGL